MSKKPTPSMPLAVFLARAALGEQRQLIALGRRRVVGVVVGAGSCQHLAAKRWPGPISDRLSSVLTVGTTAAVFIFAGLVAGPCGGKTERDFTGTGTYDCEGEIAFAHPRLKGAVRHAIGRPTGPIRGDHIADLLRS